MVTEAPICRAALTEATLLWPGRSRASDGILPSRAHTIANPTSDHELGNAFDLTHDPANRVDCHILSEWLRVSGDNRVKYIIWNRRIWNPAIAPHWRPYTNTINPHTKHMHVSIKSAFRSATALPWWQIRLSMQGDKMAHIKIYAPIKDITYFVDPQTGKPHGHAILAENGSTYGFGSAWDLFEDTVEVVDLEDESA